MKQTSETLDMLILCCFNTLFDNEKFSQDMQHFFGESTCRINATKKAQNYYHRLEHKELVLGDSPIIELIKLPIIGIWLIACFLWEILSQSETSRVRLNFQKKFTDLRPYLKKGVHELLRVIRAKTTPFNCLLIIPNESPLEVYKLEHAGLGRYFFSFSDLTENLSCPLKTLDKKGYPVVLITDSFQVLTGFLRAAPNSTGLFIGPENLRNSFDLKTNCVHYYSDFGDVARDLRKIIESVK